MEELDLKELFEIFWSKKLQIILIVLIFAVIGVVYTIGFTTPMYTSRTSLLLATSNNTTDATETTNAITTTDITINSKLVPTYRELVRSKKVLRQVISNLEIDVEEDQLRNNVTVTTVKDTEMIEISVTNYNPTYAARIANEIAKVFSNEVSETYNINNVHIVDEAEVENSPSNINHIKDIVIFVFIGLVIAVMYVLTANMLDTTIKTQEDIERIYKLPVLAAIPIYEANTQIQRKKQKSKKGGRK